MTVKELCALEGVSLCYFDGSEWHSPGFFNPALKVLAIDINLSEQDQKQVALHELGHKEHTPVQYEINRELCELQADRSMIHHLLEEELKTMVNVGHEEGVLEIEEREIINNVFQFGDMQAKEAMVQRLDMIAINSEDKYEEIIEIFKSEKFSRMPVYNESIDDIIGILNIKDIIFLSDEEIQQFNIKDYIREPFFTYEFKKITQLLEEMKIEKSQMAIVVDEYGGTAGLITIEDLVEVIVGDIEDEYDEEEEEIQVIKEDEYIVDGSIKITDVNELIGVRLESEEFDSIGGYIIGHLRRLPEENEVIEVDNIKFCIESLDKNRIKKVRIFT